MPTVNPQALGFSGARLARIQPAMQRYVDERKLAGIQTLIARKGKPVHFESVGWADIEGKQPMAEDTIFRIYSMSKPITSVAVLMLMEEGRLRIGDPLSRTIPAFKEMKVLDSSPGTGVATVPAAREITLHDLLTHTSGLSYGFDDNVLDKMYQRQVWAKLEQRPDATLAEMIEALAALPLAFQPGTRYRYSLATDVLGYVVQVVSEMPFEDYLQERIFAPLGMADTAFYVPKEKLGRFAACYQPDPEEGLKAFEPGGPMNYRVPPGAPSGGGGLVSTTSDYYRFCQMLLNKGELDGVRLLGRKTVEWMTINHLPDGVFCFDNPWEGFGLGVSVLLNPGKQTMIGSAGTFGWGGMANTNFWIDPQEAIIGILMLQYIPPDTYPVVPEFRNLAYQALVD